MTLAEASAATGQDVRVTTPDYGTDCRYAEADGGPAGLAFMVIGGRIVRIDAFMDQSGPSVVRTLSGIGLGSSEADVLAAYPGRVEVSGHPYLETGRYLVFTPTDPAYGAFSMIFASDGERVTSFRSGETDAVGAIEGCL